MDYLTEDAVFQCAQGAIIQCSDGGNRSVTFNGRTLLTIGATKKSAVGICQILTAAAQGTPQQCRCQLTAWVGFAPNKISNGSPLLTTAAKNFCPIGGEINVQVSGVMGRITD